ncbi:hypothetical protein FB451DRAFT_1170512 [Mycena latifolia]|nr:hypothetical protein FB451DRAFT_1170512 [Mycena latifolia]
MSVNLDPLNSSIILLRKPWSINTERREAAEVHAHHGLGDAALVPQQHEAPRAYQHSRAAPEARHASREAGKSRRPPYWRPHWRPPSRNGANGAWRSADAHRARRMARDRRAKRGAGLRVHLHPLLEERHTCLGPRDARDYKPCVVFVTLGLSPARVAGPEGAAKAQIARQNPEPCPSSRGQQVAHRARLHRRLGRDVPAGMIARALHNRASAGVQPHTAAGGATSSSKRATPEEEREEKKYQKKKKMYHPMRLLIEPPQQWRILWGGWATRNEDKSRGKKKKITRRKRRKYEEGEGEGRKEGKGCALSTISLAPVHVRAHGPQRDPRYTSPCPPERAPPPRRAAPRRVPLRAASSAGERGDVRGRFFAEAEGVMRFREGIVHGTPVFSGAPTRSVRRLRLKGRRGEEGRGAEGKAGDVDEAEGWTGKTPKKEESRRKK